MTDDGGSMASSHLSVSLDRPKSQDRHEDPLAQTTSSVTWISDSQAPYCALCDKNFTVFRRRHHCRFCGKVFCAKCSSHKVEAKYFSLLPMAGGQRNSDGLRTPRRSHARRPSDLGPTSSSNNSVDDNWSFVSAGTSTTTTTTANNSPEKKGSKKSHGSPKYPNEETGEVRVCDTCSQLVLLARSGLSLNEEDMADPPPQSPERSVPSKRAKSPFNPMPPSDPETVRKVVQSPSWAASPTVIDPQQEQAATVQDRSGVSNEGDHHLSELSNMRSNELSIRSDTVTNGNLSTNSPSPSMPRTMTREDREPPVKCDASCQTLTPSEGYLPSLGELRDLGTSRNCGKALDTSDCRGSEARHDETKGRPVSFEDSRKTKTQPSLTQSAANSARYAAEILESDPQLADLMEDLNRDLQAFNEDPENRPPPLSQEEEERETRLQNEGNRTSLGGVFQAVRFVTGVAKDATQKTVSTVSSAGRAVSEGTVGALGNMTEGAGKMTHAAVSNSIGKLRRAEDAMSEKVRNSTEQLVWGKAGLVPAHEASSSTNFEKQKKASTKAVSRLVQGVGSSDDES